MLQADQEADDETKDWLDNMMSNSVSVKKWSGLPDKPPLSETHKSLLRRQQFENRAMRKTLILKTGTPDITEEVSALFLHSCSMKHSLMPLVLALICPACNLMSFFYAWHEEYIGICNMKPNKSYCPGVLDSKVHSWARSRGYQLWRANGCANVQDFRSRTLPLLCICPCDFAKPDF